ncbi:MAG: endolytic transglycosylase MltG [candidate division Zixibacteria bacterium]|nr:endolytic transglycosylase MltG [candidate division Zixibacteria bacterium]
MGKIEIDGKPVPFWITGVSLVIGLVLLVGVISYYYPLDLGKRVVTVVVEKGDNFRTVSDKLVSEGVVSSQLLLKIAAVTFGLDRKLTPGRYDFSGRNSCNSVLKKLSKGDFVRIKVTIMEGSTIWQTAKLLEDSLQLDAEYTISLNKDTALLNSLELPCLEGYLFPETYYLPWGCEAEETIRLIVGQYYAITDSVWPETIAGELSRNETMILASIIEAETSNGSERELVSSVYHNRLRNKMRLDADPTVIYGLGGLDRPLWLKDLKKDTPYNTYMHKGLPPTPINSPGLAAIKAALYPEQSDFLYFVADNSGKHLFSKTNAEHNRNRQRIKREQRAARASN